jgi:DNA-binding NarL/FixJ family response regulator
MERNAVQGFLENSEVRVAIVSEQTVFGEALALALDAAPNIAVDAVVQTSDDVGLQSRRIGVILVDLEGLDVPIERAIPQLRRQAPRSGIIVLSSRANDETLRRAIEAGADGHVSKEKGLAELRRAINCVADGVTYLGARPNAGGGLGPTRFTSAARLSPREREVLGFLTLGYANREIATALNLQHKTVKNHVSNILSKLETNSRTQAVIHAIRCGIV